MSYPTQTRCVVVAGSSFVVKLPVPAGRPVRTQRGRLSARFATRCTSSFWNNAAWTMPPQQVAERSGSSSRPPARRTAAARQSTAPTFASYSRPPCRDRSGCRTTACSEHEAPPTADAVAGTDPRSCVGTWLAKVVRVRQRKGVADTRLQRGGDAATLRKMGQSVSLIVVEIILARNPGTISPLAEPGRT